MASSAKTSLEKRGWMATRDSGNMSARDMYRQMRSYGATSSEAYGVAKGYKSATTGDYYR